MTKRARGTSRPGQRRPNQRAGARPTTPPAGVPSSPAESPAAAFGAIPAQPTTSEPVRSRRASGAFSASAAQEYAYVVSDVRRIALVGGSLFATMLVLFVLLEVLHVVRI